MNNEKKEYFKNLLKRQKYKEETAIEYIDDIRLGMSPKISMEELSSFDNHPADIATEVFMVEHAMGIKAMHEDSIKKIDEAMIRLDRGKFGICKECSKVIDEERLEILPESKLCIECARKKDENIKDVRQTIKFRSPEYNEVVTSLGTKSVRDPLESQDKGKDILNELMKFGSAQSPSEEGNFKDFNEFYNGKMSVDGVVDEIDKISNEYYQEQLPE